LSDVTRVIKSRRVRWSRLVTCLVENWNVMGFCWGNLKKGDHMGDLVIDGRIILELSIMK
jgi:hypothetical protein